MNQKTAMEIHRRLFSFPVLDQGLGRLRIRARPAGSGIGVEVGLRSDARFVKDARFEIAQESVPPYHDAKVEVTGGRHIADVGA